jgi:hypothetical protein
MLEYLHFCLVHRGYPCELVEGTAKSTLVRSLSLCCGSTQFCCCVHRSAAPKYPHPKGEHLALFRTFPAAMLNVSFAVAAA